MEQMRRLKNWAWKNRKKTGFTLFTLIIGAVSSVVSTIPLIRRMKKAGNVIHQMGIELKRVGEEFHKLASNPLNLFRYPFYIPMFVFTILGNILSKTNKFLGIGISWFMLVCSIIVVIMGKISVMAYDLYYKIVNYVETVADETEKYLNIAEKWAYLNSGRDVPQELLVNEDVKKYEKDMEKYEEDMDTYNIENEAAKRENKERMENYERELVIHRKKLKEYKLALKQKDDENEELKKLAFQRKQEIKELTSIIDGLTFQITEKQKDVDFWENKYNTEKENFNRKLESNNKKHEKEKSEIKAETEEERKKLERSLEEKYKNLNLNEQKVFHHRISLLQNNLNEATKERDKLVKEKEDKEKEKEEVKTKDLISLKQPEPPVLPPKPKLVPTVKKPKKPEIPHQKMKLNMKKKQKS